jgi:hypothetical protein
MGRVKSHYHDQIANLTKLDQQQLHIPIYPEEAMTEAEQEALFDFLYAEYLSREEAYKFEDNYEPFETKPKGAVTARPKEGA